MLLLLLLLLLLLGWESQSHTHFPLLFCVLQPPCPHCFHCVLLLPLWVRGCLQDAVTEGRSRQGHAQLNSLLPKGNAKGLSKECHVMAGQWCERASCATPLILNTLVIAAAVASACHIFSQLRLLATSCPSCLKAWYLPLLFSKTTTTTTHTHT